MRNSAWILLCIFLVLQSMRSQDRADPALQSKIVALERVTKIQAFEAKDMKTLDAVLDERFVSVDAEGKLRNKAEFIAFVQEADWLQYELDAIDVRVHKDTVIVTGFFQFKGVKRGKGLLQKGRFVDTWLLKDGTWVSVASLLIPVP